MSASSPRTRSRLHAVAIAEFLGRDATEPPHGSGERGGGTRARDDGVTESAQIGPRLADDPDAFRECYQQLGPVVLAYVQRFVPRDEAEDVRQQVFLEVWRSRLRFDPDRRIEPWVLAIAKRRAIDHIRRRARNPSDPTDELPLERELSRPFTDVHAEASELREALATLPYEQRETLELAYFHDMTQPQIADQLGVPLGTVKARSFRALRKLAATLVPEDAIVLAEEAQ